MNQYPPNPQQPYPGYPQQYPPQQPAGPWQGQGNYGAPQPQPQRKLLPVVLAVAVLALSAVCGVGVFAESRETTKGPGEEVATTNVTASAPATVEYRYQGSVRRRFSVWLRHSSTTANLQGMVGCRDTSAAFANYQQTFPPSTVAIEPETGVVWIGASTLPGPHTITCQAMINAPADFVGRLVITEHMPRPSDLLGL